MGAAVVPLLLLLLPACCTGAYFQPFHASDFSFCRWIDEISGAAFDLSPLNAEEGHYAFHGVIGDHDSLLASTGKHAGFALADYVYYINLCGPATNFHFDKCNGKEPAAAFQTHKDVATNDDCFSLGAPGPTVRLIEPGRPETGIQLLFSDGDTCHKKLEYPKTSTAGVCEDVPGWKDAEGMTCLNYDSSHSCSADYVKSMAVDGIDAFQGCCASCSDWWRENVKCPALDKPENGDSIKYTNMRHWPSLAEYTCKAGFTLSGGYSKRECGADGQWAGEAPECSEEQYHGRHGRMGRYHNYNDGNGDDDYNNGETTPSSEAEIEIEWVHEPRQVLVNMTCDRSSSDTWEGTVDMAHAVYPLEVEMCEYVIQWPSKYGCPLTKAEQEESWSRRPTEPPGFAAAWLPSILFLMTYFLVLFRDGVRDYLLSLNPGVRDFFSSY